VLIATQEAEMVYRSMEEIPRPLRSKLLKSTNSANSATILIADRRGREEIARVMRSLGHTAGAPHRRASRVPMRTLLAGHTTPATPPGQFARRRNLAFLAVVLLLALGILIVLFSHSRAIP
jgi:hypothetical protein